MSETKKITDVLLKELKKDLKDLTEKLKEYIDCAIPKALLSQTNSRFYIVFSSIIIYIASLSLVTGLFFYIYSLLHADIKENRQELKTISLAIERSPGSEGPASGIIDGSGKIVLPASIRGLASQPSLAEE